MGLKISDELMEKHGKFYSLVKERYENALVLENIDDAMAAALTDSQKSAQLVAIIKSPRLTSLSFLEGFKSAEHILIRSCPRLFCLWDLSKCDKLLGVAIIDCKKICSLDELSLKPTLSSFLYECGVFNRTRLKSLAPVAQCRSLLTLDIAASGIKDKTRIDYNTQWRHLDSLTVSPAIRKFFVKLGGK